MIYINEFLGKKVYIVFNLLYMYIYRLKTSSLILGRVLVGCPRMHFACIIFVLKHNTYFHFGMSMETLT